jgi:predicted ATPase
MIKRLRVKGFKSLYDLDVTFSPLTVLFGANTSGKSNVLDVIQLLAKSATAEHIADIFEPPFRGSGFSCFSLGENGENVVDAKMSIVVDFHLSQTPHLSETYVRYSLEISRGEDGVLYISHEDAKPLDADGNVKDAVSIFDAGEKGLESRRFRTHLSSFVNHMLHYLVAIKEELRSWRVFSLDPQLGLRSVNEIFRQNAKLGPKGESLASFLYRLKIQSPFQWETFQKALALYIPEITAVEVLLNQYGELELYIQEGNKKIPIRLMSDGTLNLMGLLAMVDTNNPRGVIGIDEPENGLHPSKMGLLARLLETQAMDTQQLIVTTHSPYLLDHIPLESIYVCQKENGKTRVRPVTDLSVLSCLSDDILLSDLLASGALNG